MTMPIWERRSRGRPKLSWKDAVNVDMGVCGVTQADTVNRVMWRTNIRAVDPTPEPDQRPERQSWDLSLCDLNVPVPDKLRYGLCNSNDHSRPNFIRKYGELGIYMSLYEAQPGAQYQIGSQQYYRMNISDLILEHLHTINKVELKGKLEKLGVLKGCIIERFAPGLVMAVSLHKVKDLDALVILHLENKLTAIMQSVMVTDELRKHTQTTQINLTARLWEDEYRACREELVEREHSIEIVPLNEKPMCIEILAQIKRYQNKLVCDITKLRDIDMDMDSNLVGMIAVLRQSIPTRVQKIDSLQKFMMYINEADGLAGEVVSPFTDMLREGREVILEIEDNVAPALEMIPPYCEKPGQREIKHKIHKLIRETKELLFDEELDLSGLVCHDLAAKIPRANHGRYLSPLSIVPIVLENVIEIDALADEYISEYPDVIPTSTTNLFRPSKLI